MIVKSFTAATANAALKQVRKEMGGEAVVLQTRQAPAAAHGSRVEITACLERPSVGQSSLLLAHETAAVVSAPERHEGKESSPASTRSPQSWTELSLVPQVSEVRAIAERLRDSDIPATLAANVLGSPRASETNGADPTEAIRRRLHQTVVNLTCSGLELKPGDRLVVVGPAGCGKSSVVGRLAAEQVAVHRRKVALRTIDDAKLGAHDEAIGMAEASGALFADDSDDPSAGFSKKHINLIDTPALPLTESRRERLSARIAQMEPTHCLAVFATPMRSIEIERYALVLKDLGVTHIALTMLDLSPRWGGGLTAAHFCGSPLALVTDARGGFGSMSPPDPEAFTEQLLKPEVDHV